MHRLALSVSLVVFLASPLFSQDIWHRVPPFNGFLNTYVFHSADTVYATQNSGFLRSTNGGLTWSNAVIVNFITDWVRSPNGMIFVSQNQNRTSRSTNGGLSFTQMASGITEGSCSTIEVVDSGHVLVGTVQGIYRSTDNGAGWNKVPFSFAFPEISWIRRSPNGSIFAFANLFNVFPQHAVVYRSTDNGWSWDTTQTRIDSGHVRSIAFSPDGMVFVSTTDGIRRSSNNGDTWTLLGLKGESMRGMARAPNGNLYSYVGGEPRFYSSTDGGTSWQESGLPGTGYSGLGVSPDGSILIGLDATYRSTDAGASWEVVPFGYPSVWTMDETPSGDLYLATNRVYRSTNAGARWVDAGAPGAVVHVQNDSVIFAGENANLRRTEDRGENWSFKNSGRAGNIRSIATTPYDVVLVSTTLGLYRSTNNGEQWTQVKPGNSFAGVIHAGGAVFYAHETGSGGPGVQKSIDSGATWSPANTGITDFRIISMTMTEDGSLFAASRGGMFRSTDGAASWTKVDTQATNKPVGLYTASNSQGRLFVGGTDLSGAGPDRGWVFSSTDNGVSWTQFDSGITTAVPVPRIQSLFVSSTGRAFACTDMGLFSTLEVTTGVTDEPPHIPHTAVLEQNFPNPFNPATSIRFRLTERGRVRLSVFDLLGREVGLLLDGALQAGDHTIEWNAAGRSSGVYIAVLTTGSGTISRKMALVR